MTAIRRRVVPAGRGRSRTRLAARAPSVPSCSAPPSRNRVSPISAARAVSSRIRSIAATMDPGSFGSIRIPALPNELGQGAAIARDNRNPQRHRLERRQPESLVERRQEQQARTLVELPAKSRIDVAGQLYPPGKRRTLRSLDQAIRTRRGPSGDPEDPGYPGAARARVRKRQEGRRRSCEARSFRRTAGSRRPAAACAAAIAARRQDRPGSAPYRYRRSKRHPARRKARVRRPRSARAA